MTEHVWTALLIVTSVGAGLMGGLFFTFSNTVMSAFDRLPAGAALAAMNSINRVILNPVFLLAFFGTGVLSLILLILYLPHATGSRAVLIIVGAVLYLAGSIGITLFFNVPLNNKLAAVPPSAEDMQSQWVGYRVPWARWNHVRALACLLAAAAFALSTSQ